MWHMTMSYDMAYHLFPTISLNTAFFHPIFFVKHNYSNVYVSTYEAKIYEVRTFAVSFLIVYTL